MENSDDSTAKSTDSADVTQLREQLRLSIEELLNHPHVPDCVKESLSGQLLNENQLPPLGTM